MPVILGDTSILAEKNMSELVMGKLWLLILMQTRSILGWIYTDAKYLLYFQLICFICNIFS